MGVYARWFVASEAEVATMWSIQRTLAINPFTMERLETDVVVVDEAAIAQRPGLDRKFLLDGDVACLFGQEIKSIELTPKQSERAIARIPDTPVRSLVARNPRPAVLFFEWRQNLAAGGGFTSRFQDGYDEALAVALFDLARQAVASDASLHGYFY